jgi:hypothetical protein
VACEVIAFKFLASGALGPFTGFHWQRDVWVEADGVQPCEHGIHACRAKDLPLWLNAELWEIELDGVIVEQARKLVAQRGRMTHRIERWTPKLANEFGSFCARRTRRRVGYVPLLAGFAADVDRFVAQNRIALAAFAAARAAELRDGPTAYDDERLLQAGWLAERLGLEH